MAGFRQPHLRMLQCNILCSDLVLPRQNRFPAVPINPFETLMLTDDSLTPTSGPLTGREWIAVAGTLAFLALWLVLSFTAGAI